jgi:hypothetical protein
MSEIEEMREGIIGGMSLEVLEHARAEPDFLKFLRDLIELEGEAEAEVAVAEYRAGRHGGSDVPS